MPVFNIIVCMNLLSVCCEGKSDVAETRCQTYIMNLQTATLIYKFSGRLFPFKQIIVQYVADCYLDTSNPALFSPESATNNYSTLKELLGLVQKDLEYIHMNWDRAGK